MSKIRELFTKFKQTVKQLSTLAIFLYALAKIFIGIVELPHMKKDSTTIPYLIISALLTLGAIGCKLFKHKLIIFPRILTLQKESFLLWVITLILMIFSWSLTDNLDWNIIEKVLLVLCEFLSIFMITLLHDPKFINKMEFICFQVIFVLEILAVALKTVGFIKDHSQSPDKDIVLLNLTTQIALVIVLMDFVEKSYSIHKQEQIQDDMSRLQNQMIFTNRTRKPSKTIQLTKQ